MSDDWIKMSNYACPNSGLNKIKGIPYWKLSVLSIY